MQIALDTAAQSGLPLLQIACEHQIGSAFGLLLLGAVFALLVQGFYRRTTNVKAETPRRR
jgi:hypothetical protein